MQKTIKEWLLELPDGYRKLAFANKTRMLHELKSSMHEAINFGLSWYNSNEGDVFWRDVYSHYFAIATNSRRNGTPLPPIPKPREGLDLISEDGKQAMVEAFYALATGAIYPRQMKEFIANEWHQAQTR